MEQEPNYMKGFNDGYKMQKYTPELFEILSKSLNPNDEYQRAVLDGAKEAGKEKEANRMNDLKHIGDSKQQVQDKQRDR